MARVLVVEDDPSIAMLLSFVLGHEGHEVELCTDGYEALARLDGPVADIVVVDVMLPSEVSGLDVVREVRRRPEWQHVPAVIASALAGDDHEWRGWTAGATGYVTKPFDPEDLADEVRRQLASLDTVHVEATDDAAV